MKKEIIQTRDGSSSLFIPELNETYHSRFGAIQEAKHVFIKNGLSLMNDKSVSILEIGFGTGLNAFITFLETQKHNFNVNYVGVEAYPVEYEIIKQLNYVDNLNASEFRHFFDEIHTSKWNVTHELSNNFSLTKRKQKFQEIDENENYDIIYFDAFGFDVQPELWSVEIFEKMYKALKNNGILVTYACRSSIKKAMLEVGFSVEKLPGAPGKREMLRGKK